MVFRPHLCFLPFQNRWALCIRSLVWIYCLTTYNFIRQGCHLTYVKGRNVYSSFLTGIYIRCCPFWIFVIGFGVRLCEDRCIVQELDFSGYCLVSNSQFQKCTLIGYRIIVWRQLKVLHFFLFLLLSKTSPAFFRGENASKWSSN